MIDEYTDALSNPKKPDGLHMQLHIARIVRE